MDNSNSIAMLVTVGGATAPAIHTLNLEKPRYICFFVSEGSKPAIRDLILPALQYKPEHWDWITTSSHQNLLDCYKVLVDQLPKILEKWEVSFEDLGVEYTAGTKPMSVAAVLATIEHSSKYFYTGTSDPSGRNKGGIGIVIDGKELLFFQANPWDELGVIARKEIALLFNLGRFADARERAKRLARLSSEDMSKVYDALAELIEGYELWDRFEYKQAQVKIYKSLEQLKLYTAGRVEHLSSTLKSVEENANFLKKLVSKDKQSRRLDALDLLANATRRADNARRYDDAVARLYALLETLARNRLEEQYGIKANSARPDQIPENIREDYIRRLSDPENPQSLRLGLMDSYHLLAALNDRLGQKYRENEKELKKVLYARNQSRLAHGTDPIKSEIYEKLRSIVIIFADISEEELPKFPKMKL